jgi:hypothetical protein
MEGRKTEREEKGVDVMGSGRKNTFKLKSKIHREYTEKECTCPLYGCAGCPRRGTCPANLVVSLGFSAFFFQLTFDVGGVTIFGRRMAEHVKEELRRNYFTVERGYNSFPVPVLPWTRC